MGLLVQDRIIVPGQIVNLAAAGAANAQVVFAIPAGQLVGTKSLKIHRVNIFNNAAGNTQVLVGTGVGGAFAALLPALDTFNSLFSSYGPEVDLIANETFASITAYPVAVGAGTINVQVEVIVCG